jgi:hypothetical protein
MGLVLWSIVFLLTRQGLRMRGVGPRPEEKDVEIALRGRVEILPSGIRRFSTRDQGLGLLPMVSIWSARSTLLAYIATAAMFRWDVPSVVIELVSQCEELQPRDGADAVT